MLKNLFRIIAVSTIYFSFKPASAQLEFNLPILYNGDMYSQQQKPDSVLLHRLYYHQGELKLVLIKDEQKFIVSASSVGELEFFPPQGLDEFWKIQCLKEERYKDLVSFRGGFDWDLRLELNELSQDVLAYYEKNDALYRDLYLESYLQELVYKLYPSTALTGLPGFVNIRILKDSSPNAFVFPNGTLIINTGLLSLIKSESELIAVLAHEIAHFVLEHTLKNIRKAEERRKRAEFLSFLATATVGVIEVGLASSNENYSPGALTFSTAIIASSVSSSINEALGMKYSHDQEYEADIVAKEMLNFLGLDPNYLTNVLQAIQNYSVKKGFFTTLQASATHPNISKRISILGSAVQRESDLNYTIRFSAINTFNAQIEFQRLNLQDCLELTLLNIDAGIASGTDYLLAAKSMLYLSNDSSSNKIALGYLEKSRAYSFANSIELEKVRGIFLDRIGNNGAAKLAFDSYIQNLEKAKTNKEFTWEDYRVIQYLNEEIIWAKQMQRKLIKLKE